MRFFLGLKLRVKRRGWGDDGIFIKGNMSVITLFCQIKKGGPKMLGKNSRQLNSVTQATSQLDVPRE